MNKLLKDAIADAKAVRETALANAKAALEEAFAPKLQSMLSHKIKEEMEEEKPEAEESEEETMEIANMQKLAGITSETEDPEQMEMNEKEEMEMGAEEEMEEEPSEEEMEMSSEEEMEEPSEEEVSDEDLEEILRELEGEESEEESEGKMTMEAEKTEKEEEMEEGKKKKMMETEEESEKSEKAMDEEIDINEIIAALREEEEGEKEEKEEEGKMESVQAELNEAYGVIKFLRSKLNEVNLLNAKLLFVNKLFRKGELTESQKVKIIETFDRAKNVREAKLIYATLSESVSKTAKVAPKKKVMSEGLASAPQKKTQIISESNDVYNRFKTLVNFNR